MEFVHRPYQSSETIAALATAPGEGPVAIIRLSGKEAVAIAGKLFSGPVASFQSHTVNYGKILDAEGETIDEVLLVLMLAPRTYTGEDTIEIQCHGGSLIAKQVLEAVLKAGARAALPGEFTFRAFINGKLDLAQAEAVQELIAAKNNVALKAAEEQLKGTLSKQISEFQKELVDIAAILEAWVDFPEEGLEFASMEEVCASLEETKRKMEGLSRTFHYGKMVQAGISLCLAGAPNVGKSSLMNFLLGKERAIVTDIPGTTRDTLEEELRLGGLHFRLTDTAGIRQTEEVIEQEGIRRSLAAMESADLILLVLDASRNLKEEDLALIEKAPRAKTLLVWNKIDLPHTLPSQFSFEHQVNISAKCHIGIDALLQAIEKIITKGKPFSKEEVVITNVRHHEALKSAIDSCEKLIDGLKNGVSPEFLSSEMRQTLRELGAIIGINIGEDILSAIFSKFCVGK
ncbi:MAG TPA: tRNA uridine-5-carboxymethylaminomethyl(34) synthesis GTPase MnmE [Rhabdochlamydiaceae bacterium]|nr:tRNA uridine-5-carboxymethylaminomethyl(34) synthesis GTPase MnmE [Rhabdochlamydiaceae bacterium]